MIRRIITYFTCFTMILTIGGVRPQVVALAQDTVSSDIDLKEGTYEDGRVLVTLAAPDDTPLTEEGDVSFDSQMSVDETWDFGDATFLGTTKKQKQFLKNKTYTVSSVSSTSYSTEELMNALQDEAYVISVEPDYYQHKMSTSDPLSSYQWYLGDSDTFSSASAEGIHYNNLTQKTASKAPVVAVVDTGVDYTHEELSGKMWTNTTSLPGNYGYDFGDSDSDPMDTDSDGHGTHCAGVIAAAQNSTGITGISSQAKIMALKVFNTQSGAASNSTIVAAFNYIYEAMCDGVNVKAINCSWGGSASTSTLSSLVKKIGEKGALFIFAAGNSGTNHDATSKNTCPYDLNSPYVVTVGSSSPTDTRSSFSDYGATSVDIFAPGEKILSTVNTNTFLPAVYTSAERQANCSYYSSCDTTTLPLYTSDDLGLTSRAASVVDYQGLSHSSIDFFNKDTGSQCLSFSASSRNSVLALYLDVTDLNLDQSTNYYVCYDLALGKESISWEHVAKSRMIKTYNQRQYLQLVALEGNLTTISKIYVDNIGVSKANPSTASFGKYNIYSGTSMAAPVVTGAVAVLASYFPSDSATQRRQRLIQCVRKVDALSSSCVAGGVLDLSKVSSTKVSTSSTTTSKVKVKKVKLNKKKATLRYKKKLKLKATVTPKKATNKKIKWTCSSKKYATVSKKGVVKAKKKGIGHTVKITAMAKDGSKKKAVCKVKIKK